MEKTLPERFNIVEELLEKRVRHSPNAVAVKQVSPDGKSVAREYSYLELFHRTNKIANSLKESGILPEQRIAIMLNDGFDFITSFLAGLKIGAVPILLSTFYDEKLIKFILNDARAKFLFIDADYLTRLFVVKTELNHTKQVVSTADSDGIESLETFVQSSSDEARVEDVSRDDPAFWFFTSGSTGFPKGVVHLHRDMYFAGLSVYENSLGATNNDVFFSSAKLYFSAGMGFGLYGPLLLGASTVLFPGKPSADVLLELVSKVRPSMFLGVPSIYSKMLYEFESEKYDLSSIRLFIAGGEPLPPQLLADWKKKVGKEITDGMGSAEVCHFFTMNIPGYAKPGSVGKMLEGNQARIVDANWNDLKKNEIGILMIKGKSTFAQYWHNQEATRSTLIGEWVNTGDLAYMDEEGFLFFCGRTDHSFKVNGLWVSPIQIENEILDTGLVKECCVLPGTTADGLTEPIAYLVVPENSTTKDQLLEELGVQLRRRLSSYKVPKNFVFLESLPRTTVDKIDRSLLLKSRQGITYSYNS